MAELWFLYFSIVSSISVLSFELIAGSYGPEKKTLKLKKGNNLKKKKYEKQSYGSCALYLSIMCSISL